MSAASVYNYYDTTKIYTFCYLPTDGDFYQFIAYYQVDGRGCYKNLVLIYELHTTYYVSNYLLPILYNFYTLADWCI